jgi:putative protease
MQPPELLSPAGTFKNMTYAFAYGADAVYAGQPRYSLRARNNDFSMENLRRGIVYAHGLGKRFFVASNVLPHNNKVKTYIRDMAPIIEMEPDALIMADPGLIMLAREKWPEQVIHLSVQANTLNSASVKFWQSLGLKRIILSRELGLEEIEEIRQQCPDMELEVFVHGSLCIAYSGRCLLSGYFNHRDPNQGACTNSCRWQYGVTEGKVDDSGDTAPVKSAFGKFTPDGSDQPTAGEQPVYLLEEKTRPGEFMPIEEDENGTYILNSKDLRAIQHVAKLADIGIDSLKIEGRTKSYFYTSRTAQLYRRAIDDWRTGRAFDMDLMRDLDGMASRGYTEGFYRRHVPSEMQNYSEGGTQIGSQRFAGEIDEGCASDGMLTIDVKNKICVGDRIELMLPEGNFRFTLEHMEDIDGTKRDVAPGSGHRVRIAVPEAANKVEFGLLMAASAAN